MGGKRGRTPPTGQGVQVVGARQLTWADYLAATGVDQAEEEQARWRRVVALEDALLSDTNTDEEDEALTHQLMQAVSAPTWSKLIHDPAPEPGEPVRQGQRLGRCYLCGDPAEDTCQVCERPVCFACAMHPGGYRIYACLFGDVCYHAQSTQYHNWRGYARSSRDGRDLDGFYTGVEQDYEREREKVWGWGFANDWVTRDDEQDYRREQRRRNLPDRSAQLQQAPPTLNPEWDGRRHPVYDHRRRV